MEHQQNISGLVRLREMQRQAALYASDPEKTEQGDKIVKGKLANHFRDRATVLGIKGHAFTEWVEDTAAEGLCLAMKEFAKWNRQRSPFWNWTFEHAKSFGTRWMDRFERENSMRERLADKLFPSLGANGVRDINIDWTESIEVRLAADQMMMAELSETQQRMLKRHADGFSIVEIAESEGYSPDTVQRYINRAQDKARKVAHRYEFGGLRVNQRPKQREPASAPFLPPPDPPRTTRRPTV